MFLEPPVQWQCSRRSGRTMCNALVRTVVPVCDDEIVGKLILTLVACKERHCKAPLDSAPIAPPKGLGLYSPTTALAQRSSTSDRP